MISFGDREGACAQMCTQIDRTTDRPNAEPTGPCVSSACDCHAELQYKEWAGDATQSSANALRHLQQIHGLGQPRRGEKTEGRVSRSAGLRWEDLRIHSRAGSTSAVQSGKHVASIGSAQTVALMLVAGIKK